VVSPRLIFIHVGEDKNHFPSYLLEAVRQAARWNPTTRILIVLSRAFLEDRDNSVARLLLSPYPEDTDYWKERLDLVALEDIPPSDRRVRFMNISTLDTAFRGGFWRYTTERLMVLAEVMEYLDIDEAFHMENDNMLYGRLSELLPDIRDLYPQLASSFIGGDQATAAFLYVREKRALKPFLDFVVENPGMNDMESLWTFAAKYGRNKLALLPADPITTKHTKIEEVCRLGGVFDGGPHGQVLGGTDNGHAPGFINDRSNVAKYRYKWDVDLKTGLRRPYVGLKNTSKENEYAKVQWIPIFNLHIHCKQLHWFVS
jgi:hypothetical protein